MRPVFVNTEWTGRTKLGDYTIIYDIVTEYYTLYFLSAKMGGMTKKIASSKDLGDVEKKAFSHFKAMKGGK
jgi:hypothetical protein